MASAARTRLVRQLVRLSISAVALLVFGLHVAGSPRFEVIDRLEHYLYDVRVRLTMPGTVDERIVIIDIDESSQQVLGQWPWPRDVLAALVDRLFDEYGVSVLGMDVLFAERERNAAERLLERLPDDVSPGLREALAGLVGAADTNTVFAESVIARDVITGFVFMQSVGPGEPAATGALPPPLIRSGALDEVDVPFVTAAGYTGTLPELQENAAGGGFFDSPLIDTDGVFRRTPLLQRYEGDLYPSLGLAVAHAALGYPPVGLRFAAGSGDDGLSGIELEYFTLGDRAIPVDHRAAVFIPFRGPQESFPYVSAKDVLSGSAPPGVLDGRIALLGASAAGLMDLRSTPVGQRYIGVEVHANLIAGLLDENIRRQPAWSDGLEIVLLVLVAVLTALLLPRLGPLASLGFMFAMLAAVAAGNLWMWSSLNLVVPLASLIGYTLVASLLQITYGFFVEQRNKRHLSSIFGQYIPPALVEEIDESGEEVSLEGETREMSVLFSDVRGFTTISEGLGARELTQMMNEFLTPFTRTIQEHRGTIDKYMGDCVMAFWGAPLADPEHARHAILAAFGMLRAVRRLDEDFASKGWPSIQVGVGIASGPMNVGNMGSEFRIAYTVMGDTVNLGSRLEGLTKQYGVDIIVSDRTTALVPDFAFRELDLVRVKGKKKPVAIHEPLGPVGEIGAQRMEGLDRYRQALRAYRLKNWDVAQGILESLSQQSPHPLYSIYLERIAAFRADAPPADWDGVFEHLVK